MNYIIKIIKQWFKNCKQQGKLLADIDCYNDNQDE